MWKWRYFEGFDNLIFSLLGSGRGRHHLCHSPGCWVPETTEAVCGGGSPPSDHHQSVPKCHQPRCQQDQRDLCFREEGRQAVRAQCCSNSFPHSPLMSLRQKMIKAYFSSSTLFRPLLSQRAEAAVGEMCRHSPELQAHRRSEGLLLQDGCGCCDVSGGTDVLEDDWHQEGPGRGPRGEHFHCCCLDMIGYETSNVLLNVPGFPVSHWGGIQEDLLVRGVRNAAQILWEPKDCFAERGAGAEGWEG